jgi:hypothetical protein
MRNEQNIETALSLWNTAHFKLCFDSRAKTALNKLIQTGKIAPKDEVAQRAFCCFSRNARSQ